MNFVDNSGMEKRRHIRVPFREPITYYSIGSSDESKKTFEGKGFNLSVGGLLFICRTRFKPYEDLNLQFTLKFTGKTMEMAVCGREKSYCQKKGDRSSGWKNLKQIPFTMPASSSRTSPRSKKTPSQISSINHLISK